MKKITIFICAMILSANCLAAFSELFSREIGKAAVFSLKNGESYQGVLVDYNGSYGALIIRDGTTGIEYLLLASEVVMYYPLDSQPEPEGE